MMRMSGGSVSLTEVAASSKVQRRNKLRVERTARRPVPAAKGTRDIED